MIKKTIAALTLGMLLAANATAGTVEILYTGGEVTPGHLFSLDIIASGFGDVTAADVYLIFDPSLVQPDSVAFGPDMNLDPAFGCPGGANCPPNASGEAILLLGNIGLDIFDGAGGGLMATVTFRALGGADAAFASFEGETRNLGAAWLNTDFVPIDNPTFVGTSVNIGAGAGVILTQTALVAGSETTYTVINAEPDENVILVFSFTGQGPGRCLPPFGDLCVDVMPRMDLLGIAVADSSGTAQFTVPIPANSPEAELSAQALIRRGEGGSLSVKTNVSSDTILLPR